MPTMRAALRDRYGSPDVVEIKDVERPEPTDDQILVRVVTTSVNRADLDTIEPRPPFLRLIYGIRAPRNHRIGIDVAGVVEAVGPTATTFKPGDRVFADLYPFGAGAFAEYVAAPERAFQHLSATMSFETASTLPHSAILALQGLRTRDGRTPTAGERVLIEGASGNVGPFAVQIAKSYGAEVTGVCSGAKVDFVRSLGVDHVIDYTTTDYTATGERYDWILAADSHHAILSARRALTPGGVFQTLGGTTWPILDAFVVGSVASMAGRRKTGLVLSWKPFYAPDVDTLKAMLADGRIRPMIDRRYTLEETAEALRYVHERRNRGKVIVTVADR
jgi:NADPH:quinone reductase-like Zn-dependent oxidoreductase